MPTEVAALGFKLHTGWATLVAVSGAPGNIRILLRRRMELLPAGEPLPRFVYHKAAELPEADAATLVARVEEASQAATRAALQQVLKELRSPDIHVETAGIPAGSKKLPASLSAILGSHPLIHTAEGRLFQQAVVSACQVEQLRVTCATERDIWTRLGVAVREELDGLRKSVGPPWGADQKTAAAAALVALQEMFGQHS